MASILSKHPLQSFHLRKSTHFHEYLQQIFHDLLQSMHQHENMIHKKHYDSKLRAEILLNLCAKQLVLPLTLFSGNSTLVLDSIKSSLKNQSIFKLDIENTDIISNANAGLVATLNMFIICETNIHAGKQFIYYR